MHRYVSMKFYAAPLYNAFFLLQIADAILEVPLTPSAIKFRDNAYANPALPEEHAKNQFQRTIFQRYSNTSMKSKMVVR